MTYLQLKHLNKFSGNEQLSKDELELLMDLDEEFMRRGNFQRIFPLSSNAQYYETFFEFKRYQNCLAQTYLKSYGNVRDLVLGKHKRVYFSEV